MEKKEKKKGWSESQRKYSKSPAGLEARRRYQTSEKGRATKKAYMARRRAKLAGLKQAQVVEPTEKVEKKEESVKIDKLPGSREV